MNDVLTVSKTIASDIVCIHEGVCIDKDSDYDTQPVFHSPSTGLMYSISPIDFKIRTFKMTIPFDEIVANHRDEILNYCLGSFDDSEVVRLEDVFMHSGFVKEVK